MNVYTIRGAENIPPGAVRITEEEAYFHQKKLVNNWNKWSEVFFLKNSSYISLGLVCVTAAATNHHFRKQFLLKNYFQVSSYIPVVLCPATLHSLSYERKVTKNVLIMKQKCPLCWMIRHSIEQTLVGVAYPVAVSALFSSVVAVRYETMYVPDIQNEFKAYSKLIFDMVKRGALKFKVMIAVNLISCFLLPYMQNTQLYNIMSIVRNNNESSELLT